VSGQRRRKERIREEILRPEYASLLLEAQTVYDAIAAVSVTSGTPVPSKEPLRA
jgi:hypothetical protein